MKKFLSLSLILMLAFTLLTGCTNNEAPSDDDPPSNNEQNDNGDDNGDVDAVTTASIVDNADDFAKAISKDGTWIICALNDITTDEELVLEGEFHDKDDPSNDLYRKIALYAQDEDHNVTEEYTLTAPKLTIKSPNARIQNGTFVGDIYVEANGFNLNGTDVQGNVYFASEEYKDSFTMEDATVSGVTEVK